MEDEHYMDNSTKVELPEGNKRPSEEADERETKLQKTDGESDESSDEESDGTEEKEENDGDDEEEAEEVAKEEEEKHEETKIELPTDLIPPPDLSLEPPTESPLMPLEAPADEQPPASDEDESDQPFEARKVQNLRKNIKDVLDTTQLDASTLAAQREESERLARVQEQQRIQREQLRQIAMDRHTKAEERVMQLLQGPKPEVEREETKKEVVTIEDSSSDDDCIVVSDEEEEPEEADDDDPHNSGLHTNDSYNIPDDQGRVLVNFGHAEDEPDVFLAPQIAKIIKPHQIGGIRFLFDNIIESVTRYEQSTGFGCILAHSMGLGKTIQVVSFCDVFLRHTTSKTVLIIMPINTLQNWQNEFNMWVPETSDNPEVRTRNFKVFLLNDNHRTLSARSKVVLEWARVGGVLMIGYEMYRLLSMKKMARNRRKKMVVVEETAEEQKGMFDAIHEALVKPGPDLVICDEGHRIKNSHASVSVALKQIKSRRRVVLTGYPLQNNLIEYWCMVDFVRPNYLGSKSEFSNMFDRPIQNGQCVDSTPKDIQLMRFRAHVLHSLLVGFVQRRSHLVLRQSLPAKQEYVLLVRMTDFQRKLYETFMNEVVRKQNFPNPLKAFAVCCKIWNHPDVLFNFLKKREADLDLELDDEATSTSTASTVTPKKSRARNNKKNEVVPPPPATTIATTTTTTAAVPAFPKPEATYNNSSNFPAPSYSQFPQNFSSSTNPTYPNYNQSNPNSYPPSSQGFQDYYQQYPYNYPPRYDQYGYYGSQNYPQSSGYYANQNYPAYPTGSEYGSSNYYPPYSSQYPQFSDVKQEPAPEKPTPKSPEIPKTVDADFVNKLAEEIKDEVEGDKSSEKGAKDDTIPYDWAMELMKGYVPDLLENSPKMQVFFLLLTESIRLGDRILLFSQSLLTLNVIEKFLQKRKIPNTDMYWAKNVSYFRLDGSTVAQEREKLINNFNANPNVHLFLVSTRAGSLGINLVGANRVIVFDASWNPCHDTQAVCRVYRYGQKKPCYVYRIVMDACLEKKIYDRQISKQGMSDRVVDECNPEAHLSMKEVTSFCFDDDEVTEVQDFSDAKEEYTDSVMQLLLEQYSKQLTKKPFQHESLLVDKKEKKLSASEKRMARRGYELEKMNTSKPAYSYTSMGTTYRAYRTADGTLVHKAVQPQIRPFNTTPASTTTTTDQPATSGRASAWIPADIWQKQGMSAQEMTLPSDVVIPTSSADKENIVLKAGQRVMVLKSHRGIYMQLESGKIIAIRTTVKPENGAKKTTDQPCTSGTSKTGGDSKTDTDDDDLIMTSITYPEAKPGTHDASPRLQVPPTANATSSAAATNPNMYMNGGVRKTGTGRPRGRPPTYNGYHPSYIPAGAVPQPLQAYSRAKDYVPAPFDKSKLKDNYIPQSVIEKSVHQQQQLPVPKTSELPYQAPNHAQQGQYGYHHQQQQQQQPYSRPFENLPTQAPLQPPPYAAQTPQQPQQTNGGVRQWQ